MLPPYATVNGPFPAPDPMLPNKFTDKAGGGVFVRVGVASRQALSVTHCDVVLQPDGLQDRVCCL